MRPNEHMGTGHDSYEVIARDRRGRAECREGYAEARRAFLRGRAPSDHALSLVGALDGGPDDLAAQHEEYLRDRFDRRS